MDARRALGGFTGLLLAVLLAPSGAFASGGLSGWVLAHARVISREIHASGGYRADGRNDCYGFVRRTWNPILSFLKHHHVKGHYPGALPVGDYPSPEWRYFGDNWAELIPGDVLGTVKGHEWGPTVDYGLYGGARRENGRTVYYQFSNGGGAGPVFVPPFAGWYKYYYVPTHELLKRMRKK